VKNESTTFITALRRRIVGRERRSSTDEKEKKILLIYKEIQSGAIGKSYMRKTFLWGNAQIFPPGGP
jgi:hypothetical protein